MNFDDIIQKWNYSKEFGAFLKEIYKEFVLHFGEDKEPIIFEAFKDTEIVLCDNIYDLLIERGLLEQSEGIVKDGDYRRASGVYSANEEIAFDEETKTYKIIGIKRLVGLRDFDINVVSCKATAAHELGHMIKNYFEGAKIIGDILITRFGLMVSTYKLSYENGKVNKTLIKEEAVGLEEGLNSLLEMIIVRKLYDADYKVRGYGTVCAMASVLSNLESIRNLILNSQICDNRDFANALGDNYEKIAKLLDEAYLLDLKMYADIFASDEVKKENTREHQRVIEEFKTIIRPLYYKERGEISARDSRS